MLHTDYINIDNWFAWRPVKTIDSEWVWLIVVRRTIDYRDEAYLGLLPTYSYEKLTK